MSNVLDSLPEIDSFLGLDRRTAAYVIITLCLVHPLFYGCTVFVPLSYHIVSIWCLVLLFLCASLVLLLGIIQENPLLMTIWIWYTLIFVVLMCFMMIIMALVLCSKGHFCRIILVLIAIAWYLFLIYCVLEINMLRKTLEKAVATSLKALDKSNEGDDFTSSSYQYPTTTSSPYDSIPTTATTTTDSIRREMPAVDYAYVPA